MTANMFCPRSSINYVCRTSWTIDDENDCPDLFSLVLRGILCSIIPVIRLKISFFHTWLLENFLWWLSCPWPWRPFSKFCPISESMRDKVDSNLLLVFEHHPLSDENRIPNLFQHGRNKHHKTGLTHPIMLQQNSWNENRRMYLILCICWRL